MSDDLLAELGIEVKPFRVHVCLGPHCTRRGSPDLLRLFDENVWLRGLQADVEVLGTSCRDRCDFGPSVNVYPGPVLYNLVDAAGIEAIVEKHLSHGEIVEEYRFRPR
ncbi:MAG: ferredoxin [Thermomicrobiales bacterium]